MGSNVAAAHEAVAEVLGDRTCLIWRDRSWSWVEVTDRTRRLANLLAAHGIGRRCDHHEVQPWESPHDHVALHLLNSNTYLEGMLGSWKAGASAFNVNHRYVADELRYLFDDSATAAIIYHGRFAQVLGEVLPTLRNRPRLLLRADDGSGDELLPGALDLETALATASATPPGVELLADDRYVVYTGGTTGRPKGVLWRQADFMAGALGIEGGIEAIVAGARDRTLVALPTPPLMHGAAHWNALSAWIGGGTIVIQSTTDRLDAGDVLDCCERHGVTSILLVGDAFARPIVDEQRERPRDLSTLRHVLTGGAILSPSLRSEILELAPHVKIVDVLGSSESGRQAVATASGSGAVGFRPGPDTMILSEDRTRFLAPEEDETGWLARGGPIPLGYLGDSERTAETFPVVDGRRVAVAGDRAAWAADGTIRLVGRDSVTINTGGEKVFAEEVEQAIKQHPGIYDVLVVGAPSERWGQEVAAVASTRPGTDVTLDELRDLAAEQLAGYKLPKRLIIRDRIERSPSGKPDYAWAREQAAQG